MYHILNKLLLRIDFLAGSLLVRIFYENYQKFIQNIAMDCQQSAAVAELPLHVSWYFLEFAFCVI